MHEILHDNSIAVQVDTQVLVQPYLHFIFNVIVIHVIIRPVINVLVGHPRIQRYISDSRTPSMNSDL